MNEQKITTKLEELPIEELAFRSEFVKSHHHKISGYSFVLGFFHMILEGCNTAEKWASQICRIIGTTISTQSLQEKIQFRQVKFCEMLLGYSLRQQVRQNRLFRTDSRVLSSFERVFTEDSTCVKVPKNLFAFFPGTVNQSGASCSARVQLRLELKSGQYTHVGLQSYRDNDQKFSSHILHQVKQGDLVIRDLGYWALWVFRLFIKQKAFFLSRFQYGTQIFEAQSRQPIDLYKKLRSLRRAGISILDTKVIVGKQEQVPLRLVAIKAPQQVIQQRKRKMRKDKKAKRSKDYWEMVSWSIFVTNVSNEVCTPEQILEVYGYRWRIEMVFKCWKSKFKLVELFEHKTSMSPPRALIGFYLLLVWLTLFFVNWYNFFLQHIYRKKRRILSIFKFAQYLKFNFERLINSSNPLEELDFLARYCVQNKRKTKSQLELIHMLNLT